MKGEIFLSSVLPGNSVKIIEKENPILSVCANKMRNSIYYSIGGENAGIYRNWLDKSALEIINLGSEKKLDILTVKKDEIAIKNNQKTIKNYAVLKDFRHILFEYSDYSIIKLDLLNFEESIILQERKQQNFKEVCDSQNSKLEPCEKSFENWCKIDIKLGNLVIILTESNWLKCKGNYNISEDKIISINYGEHLVKSMFLKMLENKYRVAINKLENCEEFDLADNQRKILANLQEQCKKTSEKMPKFGICIHFEDISKRNMVHYEDLAIVSENIPKWILNKIYESVLPAEEYKIKFSVEPIKLSNEEEKILSKDEFKAYNITCNTDTLIKDITEIVKNQVTKISSRIKGVSIFDNGHYLHPMAPLGLIIYKKAENLPISAKLNLQFKIKL